VTQIAQENNDKHFSDKQAAGWAITKLVEKSIKHDSSPIQRHPQPTIATTDVQEAAVAGLATS